MQKDESQYSVGKRAGAALAARIAADVCGKASQEITGESQILKSVGPLSGESCSEVDYRHQYSESACTRCFNFCHREWKSGVKGSYDNKGADKQDCKHHSSHDKQCPWRIPFVTLIGMLRCKMIPGSGAQDQLLNLLLSEHGMDSLRLAFHILRGQCLDGEQRVRNDY